VDPETNEHASGATLSLAREHGLSVYDAAYLELALRRGATLATFDGPLRDVAKKLGVPLLPKKLVRVRSATGLKASNIGQKALN